MIDQTEEHIRIGRAATLLLEHELFGELVTKVESDIVHAWRESDGSGTEHAELRGFKALVRRITSLKEQGLLAQRKVDAENARWASAKK
jgi:hypothetical protein